MPLILNQTVDPMTGRMWFKLRTLVNYGVSICFCVFLVAALSLIVPYSVADLITITLATYIYFSFLEKRAIKIRCEHCGRPVLSNTPWVCGFCGKTNQEVDDFPFIYQCKHCGAAPKAYKCHYADCGELIFLTEDRLEKSYAFCLNTNLKMPEVNRREEREEQRQEKEHKIIMAELDDRLASIRRQRQYHKPKTAREQKKESLEKHYDGFMAAEELAEKKRDEIAEMYKNDPERRSRANAVVDEWLERNLP